MSWLGGPVSNAFQSRARVKLIQGFSLGLILSENIGVIPCSGQLCAVRTWNLTRFLERNCGCHWLYSW